MNTKEFIAAAFLEDVGGGDYSTLACIPPEKRGKAILKIKEDGIICGMSLAEEIFRFVEPGAEFMFYKKDGDKVSKGEIAFTVSAGVHTILKAERLVLNCMQRMSGIASITRIYVDAIKDYPAKILDTRKTAPLFRQFEKEAVRAGGGENHRMGLYDMVMLKDNHIDYCGGIEQAIEMTRKYLDEHNLDLKIEVETRSIDDVQRVLNVGKVDRIMLDNYTPQQLDAAVRLVGGRFETEASGGITLENIVDYARTGVDYISVGAIIHHAVSMDLSLKAEIL